MTDEQSTAGPADGTADAPPEDVPPGAQRPPLARSGQHRVVAGVCGGLGRHLDIDPVVFRVVVAVLCLSGGLGLFLYGLAWLIVPREPVDGRPGRTELQRVLTGRVDGQSIGAVLLTVIGTGVFFSSMGDGGQLFPLLLLGGLVFLAVRYDPERRRRARGDAAPAGADGPYDRLEEPVEQLDWKTWQHRFGQDFQTEWRARKAEMHKRLRTAHEEFAAQHARDRAAGRVPQDTPPPGPSGYLWDPRHPERNPYGSQTPPPGVPAQAWWQRTDLPQGDPLRKPSGLPEPPQAPEPVVPPVPPRPTGVVRHGGGGLGGIGVLLAIGSGALAWWLTDRQGQPVHIATVLAAALLAIGLVMLVGARWGRARGLAVPALLLTLVLAAAGGSNAALHAGVGDRLWAPATASSLQEHYDLGAGDATLDLTGLDPAGASLASTVRVGAGDLKVLLRKDVDVELTVHNLAGDIRLPNGEHLSGTGNNHTYTLHPPAGTASRGTLDLTLTVGLGDIKVVQS
ncbi:PspC domain-containing protein [Kitasatospora sp. NPDC085879]|uniref:PspC domain-containing protein n=1 Tax=Kitasatospora sp. NPDC085879 TaxID=3154769 RepID=UPI003448D026